MSKNKQTSELLNNDKFIAWISSKKIQFNKYWISYQTELDIEGKDAFEQAITTLEQLYLLNIDGKDSIKSHEFIQDQYIKLLEDSTPVHKASKIVQFKPFLKYAAAIAIIAVISIKFLFTNNIESTFKNHLTQVKFNTTDILIQSATQEYFKITSKTNQKWLTKNGVFITVDGDEIRFTASNNINTKTYSNFKIVIPKGKNYQLNLIDGTEVELNSGTTFSFNNATNTSERNVALVGEAFFVVAHNKNRPFKVQSSDMLVEVLGTEFNISNYNKLGYTSTTLVEGSIKVSNPHLESEIIKPGYQAKLYHNQNQILVNSADVQAITSWTNNRIVFNNEKLSVLLPKLSKWFDVEFKIEGDNAANFEFTGTLKRESDLNHFLQMLEYTAGIKYTINNKTVTLIK